jgi:F-type H+-transporting ATPase subunit b
MSVMSKLTTRFAIGALALGLVAPAAGTASAQPEGAPAEALRRPADPDQLAIRPPVPPEDPPPVNVGDDRHTLAEGAEGNAAEHGHADPTRTFNFFKLHYGKDQYGGKVGDGVQGPHDEPEEPMSGPFAFMLINFGLLLVLLGKFGGPAARKMAETRSDEIKSALDEAARLRKAAADKLDEYTARLAAAQGEMATMLTNMRADAEAEKQRIMASAEQQAALSKRDAELRIAAEIERARIELAREVSLAAAGVAERLLRERTTAADQAAMVDTFIKDVESAARGRAGVA